VEPNDFKKWRKSLKLSQKEAAHALGLKRRMIQYYEKGERDGDKVEIPRSVRLACYALVEGVEDYHGPSRKIKRREERPKKDAAAETAETVDAVT
jgi:transcriptional regulator with XRE-family HTH domain